MKKRVLLIGGYSETQSLAASLLRKGYRVVAINENADDCRALAEIDKLEVYVGDGTKPFVLEDADAYGADIAIALTSRDEDNLVICELCKKKFGVKKTVAIIGDPKKTDFFYRMGIDSVLCSITALSSIIEQQALLDEVATLVPIGAGKVRIAQVPIAAAAPAVDKKLSQIDLKGHVIVGFILRNGQTLIPRGDTTILAGDVLVLLSADAQERAAVKELTGR